MTELELRKAICDVGRRLYEKNLALATDGNISVRLGPDRYLCTPSGVSKGFMRPDEILVADGNGRKFSGEGKVTSEFATHMAAYNQRPDVHAVVHAHPPKAIGLSIAEVSLAELVLPEVVYTIGGIPTSDYATPGTEEGAMVIHDLIKKCDALIIDRHGAVSVGRDLFDALYKMEKIEHAAESLLIAHLLGNVRKLGCEQVQKLQVVRKAYNVSGHAYLEAGAECSLAPGAGNQADTPELDAIVEETLRSLGYT